MSGVEVNRLNLVTKIAVITSSSTRRENHSLPQASQVCLELFILVPRFVVKYGMTNIRPIRSLQYFPLFARNGTLCSFSTQTESIFSVGLNNS